MVADLATAQQACEATPRCVGIHYDAGEVDGDGDVVSTGDYLLLSMLGTPNKQEPGRRACYKLRENTGRRQRASSRQALHGPRVVSGGS